jgi:hypothetical protein
MKFCILFIIIGSKLFAQTTYFNIQFDYQKVWDGTPGMVETDSHYIAVGLGGAPWLNDTVYLLRISKTGEIDSLNELDFFFGSTPVDILPSKKKNVLDFFGMHYDGIDDIMSVDLFLCRMDGITFDAFRVRSFGIPGFGDYSLNPMLRTSDGGIAITGYRFAPNTNGQLLLLKVDSLWQQVIYKTYFKNSWENQRGHGLVETPDKGFIIVGSRSYETYDRQAAILRVDSVGNLKWWKDIVPQGNEESLWLDYIVSLQEDGTYLVIGQKQVFIFGFARYQIHYILGMNEDGEILWEKEYGDDIYDDVWWRGLSPCQDGNFLTYGVDRERVEIPDHKQYGVIAKLTPTGEVQWERRYTASTEGNLYDVFWKTIPTSDGGILCAGTTWGDSLTRQNSWIVKLDSLGCLEPGCAPTAVVQLPVGERSPVKIYPNPTGGRFTVEAQGGRLIGALKVYDLNGRTRYEASGLRRALVGGVWVTRQVVRG